MGTAYRNSAYVIYEIYIREDHILWQAMSMAAVVYKFISTAYWVFFWWGKGEFYVILQVLRRIET